VPVSWPDDVDEVIGGDLTAAVGYRTPAGGAVVTPVAPIGMRDRDAGTVDFTTSLGFGRKLERLKADPRVALAYHAREHGFSTSPAYVLVQGRAAFDPTPDPAVLDEVGERSTRFMGPPRRGRVWDWWLQEYYADRLLVRVTVERAIAWPDPLCQGEPEVHGPPPPERPPESQAPPKNGTGPRVDLDRAAHRIGHLPHRLLAFAAADGFPTIVPISLGARQPEGVQVFAAPGIMPPGGRRAGLVAHSYRAKLVGLVARQHTGWLDVDPETGRAVYAPHTESGFLAPANKTALLIGNGAMAKYGLWKARREGRDAALRS
jgi:hypothetical protein